MKDRGTGGREIEPERERKRTFPRQMQRHVEREGDRACVRERDKERSRESERERGRTSPRQVRRHVERERDQASVCVRESEISREGEREREKLPPPGRCRDTSKGPRARRRGTTACTAACDRGMHSQFNECCNITSKDHESSDITSKDHECSNITSYDHECFNITCQVECSNPTSEGHFPGDPTVRQDSM